MAPDRAHIRSIFEHLGSGDTDSFFSNVIPNVEWTVNSHSVLGGTYHSVEEFKYDRHFPSIQHHK